MLRLIYKRFKGGDFDTKDKERPSQPRKFEEEDFEVILNENPCQTLNELTETLNVTDTAVNTRLYTM